MRITVRLILGMLIFNACEKEINACLISDFEGSWVGIENCDNIGEITNTFTITSVSDTQISLNDGAITLVADVDNCHFEFTGDYTGEGDLSGNNLEFSYDDGFLLNCSVRLSKQ